MDSVRIDRWLWAVRLYKTRQTASDACRGGKVRVNGDRVKPSAAVRVGDTVRARVGDRERIVEVARLLDRRVGAPVAAECLIDRSPPPPARSAPAPVPTREPGAGRPTKRERRQMDRLRSRRR